MGKVIISIILAFRAYIALYLVWLGCRWLLATNSFSDLILNAVALEFILCLKDTLYATLMSRKNKHDVSTTKVLPGSPTRPAGVCVFVGTLLWMLVAVCWVLIYMGIPNATQGLQTVLPDYRWDLREVCSSWVDWRYCVSAVCPESPT